MADVRVGKRRSRDPGRIVLPFLVIVEATCCNFLAVGSGSEVPFWRLQPPSTLGGFGPSRAHLSSPIHGEKVQIQIKLPLALWFQRRPRRHPSFVP